MFLNGEYYPDPTAGMAILNTMREENIRKRRLYGKKRRKRKSGKSAAKAHSADYEVSLVPLDNIWKIAWRGSHD